MKLVERFGVMQLGSESLLPPYVRQLNKKPDDFRTRLNTHLETNDLKKETEEAEGATQMATTTMRDAAAVACLRRSSAAALATPALPSASLASAVHASTDPAPPLAAAASCKPEGAAAADADADAEAEADADASAEGSWRRRGDADAAGAVASAYRPGRGTRARGLAPTPNFASSVLNVCVVNVFDMYSFEC